MPWIDDKFQYTTGLLRAIANSYVSLYEDGLWIEDKNSKRDEATYHIITDLFAIAEFKADFDMALQAIGKGEWRGLESHKFGDYKYFGRLQQTIIAVILDIPDKKMEGMGFIDVKGMRRQAYWRMRNWLNYGKILTNCNATPKIRS